MTTFTGRVLLAEDCVDAQALFSYMLQRLGMEVQVVGNGKECVDAATKEAEAGNPFELILVDLDMPVMDGCTAVKLLRQNGYKNPIVAITAGPSLHDMKWSLYSGCNAFLAKTNIEETLESTIAPLLAEGPPELSPKS